MIRLHRYDGAIAERTLILGPVEFSVEHTGSRYVATVGIGWLTGHAHVEAGWSAPERRIPGRRREIIVEIGPKVFAAYDFVLGMAPDEPTITPLMVATESLYDRAP